MSVTEGEKILIVDDDERLRRLLERFLSEQGYRVRGVENAEQMDRVLARELFNLVVLDLMMPGEDGLSVCSLCFFQLQKEYFQFVFLRNPPDPKSLQA